MADFTDEQLRIYQGLWVVYLAMLDVAGLDIRPEGRGPDDPSEIDEKADGERLEFLIGHCLDQVDRMRTAIYERIDKIDKVVSELERLKVK